MICSRKKSAWCIQTIPHSLSVREFRPWKPKQLLKRRDKLMNAVSVKGLICKPKLHERTAYIRLKRSEKLIVYNVPAINIQCWFSVIWLLNDELKIDADKTRFPNNVERKVSSLSKASPHRFLVQSNKRKILNGQIMWIIKVKGCSWYRKNVAPLRAGRD